MAGFLPISPEETRALGWEQVDIFCVTGDAYVDHPSFGMAIVSGSWKPSDIKWRCSPSPIGSPTGISPNLAGPGWAFVNGGNIDSMVNNYTAAKRKRHDDSYSPGNVAGRRPDRPLSPTATKSGRSPDIPIVIGDWRHLCAGLPITITGMMQCGLPSLSTPRPTCSSTAWGKQTAEIARRLALGEDPKAIRDIRGTCYLCQQFELPQDAVTCASFHRVSVDKEAHARPAASSWTSMTMSTARLSSRR